MVLQGCQSSGILLRKHSPILNPKYLKFVTLHAICPFWSKWKDRRDEKMDDIFVKKKKTLKN